MKNILIIGVIGFLALLIAGCSESIVNSFSGKEKELAVKFCKNFSGEDGCAQSQNVFGPNDDMISASIAYSGKAADFFTIDWWYLDENERVSKPLSRQAGKDDVILKFQMKANSGKWKKGKYALRIYRNSVLEPLVNAVFEIRG